MSAVFVSALAGAGVSLASTPIAMASARRLGVVDRPGPLKPQATPVPYLGGAAVFVAIVPGAALGHPIVLVPMAMALVLGVLDDIVSVSPGVRLVGQGAVGGVVAAVVATRLSGPVGPILVVALTMLLINGVNLLDGLDTMAAGIVALASGTLAILVPGATRVLGVAAACALVGFLVFNRPPARVYLGDGGAYLLGTVLAVLIAGAWAPGVRRPVAVASLIVVALPAAEVAFTVVRRLRGRRALAAGDRGHSYDRLVTRGLPAAAAGIAYGGGEALLGGVALAVSSARSVVGPAIAAAAVAIVLVGAGVAGGVVSPERGAST
jgi:UDP-GlcNAc:undecaprenyl-phosphate GlcNAc-1-phosphate transferase